MLRSAFDLEDGELRPERGMVFRQADYGLQDRCSPIEQIEVDIDGQGGYRGAEAVDGDVRPGKGGNYPAEEARTVPMREEGQGADPFDLRQAPGHCRGSVCGTTGIQRQHNLVNLQGVGCSHAETAAGQLAFATRTEERHVDPALGDSAKQVGQRPVDGGKLMVAVVNEFDAEPDPADSDPLTSRQQMFIH